VAKHKGYTFRPGTVSRFAKKHGIRFSYIEVYAGMICMKQDHPGQKFFILKLSNPEGRTLRIPYMQGAAVKGFPELKHTLEMIADDSRLYFEVETAEEYCAEFSIDEWECEKAFEILKSLVGRSKEFFGEKAFDELMNMQEQGYEMEGDTGWRRHQICGW